MVTFRFAFVCWLTWASFVLASPVRRSLFWHGDSMAIGTPKSYNLFDLQLDNPHGNQKNSVPPGPEPAATKPTGPPSTSPDGIDYKGKEPCAVASTLIQQQLVHLNSTPMAAKTLPTIPAQMGMDCLMSVPLNKSAALALMGSLKPYLQWQSTTSFLQNPPAEYLEKMQGPVDVMGLFGQIMTNLNNDVYKSEYKFGADLYNVTALTHDGHFNYVPDSFGSIFAFSRPVTLVSISSDGMKLPVPFVYTDVVQATYMNKTYTPSRIMKINGIDATTFLERESQIGPLQDRDALYNSMFYSLPQVSLYGQGVARGMFTGSGFGRFSYPGPTTTLEFANGTTRVYRNVARAAAGLVNVTDGSSLYQRYFTTPPIDALRIDFVNDPMQLKKPQKPKPPPGPKPPPMPAPGYPQPVFRHSENLNGGYYLDDAGYQDVAVLNIASFVGDGTEVEFQGINTNFIKKAVADGKTKLIIDLSANGGGTILQGYDLFKQLFPQMTPYGATRFRAHPGADELGQIYTKVAKGLPHDSRDILEVVVSPFNADQDLNVNNERFTSWADKYSPRTYNNDQYSGILRWNLNDPLLYLSAGGINMTGYANRTGFVQPFKAENIVMITDGYCASTCTIFSEFMRQQAGVKSIAFGGRSNNALTQSVGGVKGTSNFEMKNIQQFAQLAFNYSTIAERMQMINNTEIAKLDNGLLFDRAAGPPGINFRDGLRQGDDSGTPLQFRYEPADCRIYYTADMTVAMTAMWKAAADSMWGNTNWCVAGGLNRGQGMIGQLATTNQKRANPVVTSQFATAMGTRLADEQASGIMDSMNLFTEHDSSKLWSGRGLMRAG